MSFMRAVVVCKQMEAKNHSAESGSDKRSETPVMDNDAELTPKAKAKVANKLPRREQLKHFEEELELQDSGNQPA